MVINSLLIYDINKLSFKSISIIFYAVLSLNIKNYRNFFFLVSNLTISMAKIYPLIYENYFRYCKI